MATHHITTWTRYPRYGPPAPHHYEAYETRAGLQKCLSFFHHLVPELFIETEQLSKKRTINWEDQSEAITKSVQGCTTRGTTIEAVDHKRARELVSNSDKELYLSRETRESQVTPDTL